MKKIAYSSIFLGAFLILASLQFPPLLWKDEGVVEAGTYELYECDASYLLVNSTPCISAYIIDAELLGSEGTYKVAQPLMVARGDFSFELRRGDAKIERSYHPKDRVAIIPVVRGDYELKVDGDVEVYEIRGMRAVNLSLERGEGGLKIYCVSERFGFSKATPTVLLHSQKDISYRIEAYGNPPNSLLLLLGVAFLLVGLVMLRARKSGGGEGEEEGGFTEAEEEELE